MSFFIRSKSSSIKASENNNGRYVKRKKKETNSQRQKKKKVTENGNIKHSTLGNEEIESDLEDETIDNALGVNLEFDSDDAGETAQDKKVRLAKLYLDEIEKEELQRAEAGIVDKDVIAHRLKEDYLEQAGKLRKTVADNYVGYNSDGIQMLRCKEHKLPITCLVLSSDNKFVYSASKDSAIVKWSLIDRCKVKCITRKQKGSPDSDKGHTATVLCLAISSDGRFLASGGENKTIQVWNPDSLEHIHTFKGHNGAVTGLAFRKGTHQLFSVSEDKAVKIWSLDEMAYVESLFGHQTGITSVDVLSRERAVTSGGRDHTVRIWKIIEESQLIYNGHVGSIDAVKLVNEEHFFSCGDDGQLCLWGTMKKKPLCTVNQAHGVSAENEQPKWISSIAALVNTDLVASGSHDGHVRLWKCDKGFRSLTPIVDIPVVGFVNAMAFTSDGDYIIVGTGQEHRLGRWWKEKEAKNGILIIPLSKRN
ncbi:U3 small nucleolar RNA-interacting protein 2 [Periplaneta americana]|uniref:U3 small nucleolar RNA-interacting protein 2 n=1 Tax=Periplaneta americana TaxID=6978 RepID=UPI0037E75260